MPKVSIIVPVYKTEKYLDRCVKSLVEQTLRDIEIILVDDGSPDNCPLLCDEWAKKDGRIRVIHKENAGVGMARNAGLDAACGEYIGFIDSDDYTDKNMYARLFEAAEKYSAELVMSCMCFDGGNMFSGGGIEKFDNFTEETLFSSKDDINRLALGIAGAAPNGKYDSQYSMSVCKNIYKADTLKKSGVRFLSEREILSEDALFLLDFTNCIERAAGISDALYYYVRNGNSISKSYDPDRIKKCLIFLGEIEKRIKHIDGYELYFNRLVQAFGRVLCSQEIMNAKENNIGYFELRGRLKTICNLNIISSSLKNYPIFRLPKMQAAFAFMIKHKLYFLQVLAVVLRSR